MSVTDDIKAKLDILDVVAPYATIQKSGRTFKANCPFHTERTPSFIVSPERQSWRCFGACATGGDIFSFVMRAENLQFGDALRLLARRAGVELQTSGERAQSNAIHSVNSAAATYYQETLASETGARARGYLDERGVGQRAREQFKLGLSPSGWDGLKRYLQTHGLKLEDAIEAGLARQGEDGRTWDFFRNRLMFPIFDRDHNIAGFGGRALDDSNPKYINTAQTEVFDKRNILYALNFAAPTIRQSGTAIIVEGYMDAIAAHERGYANVVASMGTALTENQVSQMRSLAQDFVLALDPDAAGQEATLRSLESSWRVFRSVAARRGRSGQSVLSQWKPPALKIAALPAGLDPDALIRSDVDRWDAALSDALPLLDFVIPALVERTDLTIPDSRAAVVRELGRLINQLDEMDQYEYWGRLADALGVPLDTLSAAIASTRPRRGRRRDPDGWQSDQAVEVSSKVLRQGGTNTVEEYVLALLIQRPSLIDSAGEVSPECFRHTENRELFTTLLAYPTIVELRDAVEPELVAHLDRLRAAESPQSAQRESHDALKECLRRLELQHEREKQETLSQTDEPGDPPSWEVEAHIRQVNQRIRELEPMGVRQAANARMRR